MTFPVLAEEPYVHFLLAVSGEGGGAAVVQFDRRTGTDLGEDLPRVLALHPERIVLLEEDPYPRITVATLGGG